jgi:hypothetical protein
VGYWSGKVSYTFSDYVGSTGKTETGGSANSPFELHFSISATGELVWDFVSPCYPSPIPFTVSNQTIPAAEIATIEPGFTCSPSSEGTLSFPMLTFTTTDGVNGTVDVEQLQHIGNNINDHKYAGPLTKESCDSQLLADYQTFIKARCLCEYAPYGTTYATTSNETCARDADGSSCNTIANIVGVAATYQSCISALNAGDCVVADGGALVLPASCQAPFLYGDGG